MPAKVNLVLQPMTRASELREGLYENGFVIKSEKACRDGRFVYSVINAEYRGETRKLTPLQALIGGLDMTKPESLEYASAVCVIFRQDIIQRRSHPRGRRA